MTATPHSVESTTSGAPLHRGRGCGSVGFWYIAATVAGFVIFWPIGLAMLAWAFWRDEIRSSSLWHSLRGARVPRGPDIAGFMARRPSNAALAEYLAREQRRLRDEQEKLDELVRAFEAFKEAERQANDQRDFENFLRQRQEGAGRDEGPGRDEGATTR